MQKEITVRDKKLWAPESFMELGRTVRGYLFDEVVIRQINFVHAGREIHYSYRRNGKVFDMNPLVVTAQEFRTAAVKSKEPGSDFAKTSVADKLFAEGARQYSEKHAPIIEDAIADADFIDELAGT